jgi:DNA gyrase subunit A
MEVGIVKKIDIDQEMQQAYLDYAMSVIVARALPDARDGLKPVHRRILYAMHDMGLRADGSYKKSARIVGEVLGKYHPHSDAAVYDAMVRMVQEFSLRYPLVDGQGNFGSVDGDPAAAMRYTEAKLASPAVDLLSDIQKNTVEFSANFDDTLLEPDVLPASIPNLLVNGATGIAVGMSTSVPPHNLGEVVDALVYMLSKWEKLDDINVEQLMKFIQGPDFPTGGVIIGADGAEALKSAYGTGRGRITVQARAHTEEMSRGRTRIIVTELPYMTNKSSLIERIASLVREGKLEGISDLRDESDREGMRIVIELSKGIDPDQVLKGLYNRTPMRTTFSIINLALVGGEPRLLSLKQALRVYLDHRLEVVKRRTQFDLNKARERAHILEGLLVALKNLDEVISIIRKSRTAETAQVNLKKRFKLTDTQATAILNMPLRRLAALERKKIEEEHKGLLRVIKQLEGLLRSPKKMRLTIAEELHTVKENYADRRRTQIVALEGNQQQPVLTAHDLIPESDVYVSITPDGLVSRTRDNKPPRLSGRSAPMSLLKVNTRDTLFLVGNNGKAAALAVHALPEASKPDDGTPYHRLSPLRSADGIAGAFNLPSKDRLAEDWFVITGTRGGMVKRSAITELPGPTAQKFTLAKVNDGDRLGWVALSPGGQNILLGTAKGMTILFEEDGVRPMGLVATGVMGIKLKVGDEVVGMELLPLKGDVLLVSSHGHAKRITPKQFPVQGRYGQGVTSWKLAGGVRLVGMVGGKGTLRITMHLAKLAPKQMRIDDAPLRGRPAQGKSILELKAGDSIVDVHRPFDFPRPLKPVKKTRARKAKK